MKKQALMIAGAALAMAFSAFASAQGSKFNPGPYVGVEGGYVQATVPKHEGYRITSESKNAGFVRGMLGYQFTPNWALELGYFGTGDVKRSDTNGAHSYDEKYKASGADLAVLYKLTEMLPGIYVKAGLTYAKVTEDIVESRAGGFKYHGSGTGTGYLFGLGYEYDFTPAWSANANYTRYQRVANVPGVNLNQLGVGVKYRF
ncbi:porin family protein [Herbaspirillum sp. WKF16]|jgi:opacity protein-like surface antigen|uniref:porin family protein n=1 Tax=Herbaspirillum sp. WKF16 TaxID=3028312 RepID=UPI0023A9CC15|nr:porin family protein [Herbaspirillum sp. WKF16]WDZ97667.1 porin family protein [Herbaspirillum sp. WKF16]